MMATKPEELPSLDDDLTVKPSAPLRLRPRTIIPDSEVQANSRSMGEAWGASTHVRAPEPLARLAPLEPLRIAVPEYLARELRVRCAEGKVTIAYLVMAALRKDGFRIEDKDLVKGSYKRGRRE